MTGTSANSKPESVRQLNQFGDDYFSGLKFKDEKKESYTIKPTASNGHQNFPIAEKLTSLPPGEIIYGTTGSSVRNDVKKPEKVGDIISGRIPGDHNPFGNIGGDRRPNNIVTSSTSNIGDASNLVVSSVIKFSR